MKDQVVPPSCRPFPMMQTCPQEIRDDALHMLRVLSMRVWREGLVAPRGETEAKGGASPRPQAPAAKVGGAQEHVAVVVGNLQDTYQQFQYQVSAKLARWGAARIGAAWSPACVAGSPCLLRAHGGARCRWQR